MLHAADEYGFRPFEVRRGGRGNVFVDEADRPIGGQIGRDQQQALRRHEGLNAVGQRIGVFQRAERGRIAREHAQNAPYRLNALGSHRTSSEWQRLHQISTPTGSWAIKFLNIVATLQPADCRIVARRCPRVRGRSLVALRQSGAMQNRPAMPLSPARRNLSSTSPTPNSQSSNSGARFSRTDPGHKARRGTRWTDNSA